MGSSRTVMDPPYSTIYSAPPHPKQQHRNKNTANTNQRKHRQPNHRRSSVSCSQLPSFTPPVPSIATNGGTRRSSTGCIKSLHQYKRSRNKAMGMGDFQDAVLKEL